MKVFKGVYNKSIFPTYIIPKKGIKDHVYLILSTKTLIASIYLYLESVEAKNMRIKFHSTRNELVFCPKVTSPRSLKKSSIREKEFFNSEVLWLPDPENQNIYLTPHSSNLVVAHPITFGF